MGGLPPPEPEIPDREFLRELWKLLWMRRRWFMVAAVVAASVLLWRQADDDGEDATNDHLQVDNAPAGAVPVSLVDGLRGSTCLVDEAFKGSGLIDLGGRMSSAGCPSEVVTFSTGRAVEFQPGPVWSGSAATPLPVQLKDRVQVPFVLYIPDGDPGVLLEATAQELLADDLYDDNRVGIHFLRDATVAFTAGDPLIGDGCTGAASLVSQGPARGLYNPKFVNVYYVPLIDGWDAHFGYDCWEEGFPNIIYISYEDATNNTLAHELGHALALRGAFGHTNTGEFCPSPPTTCSTFTKKNLMWAKLDSTTTDSQDVFSLGQAYRMNVELSSWANQTAAGPPRGAPSQDCGTAPLGSTPCPALDFDVP